MRAPPLYHVCARVHTCQSNSALCFGGRPLNHARTDAPLLQVRELARSLARQYATLKEGDGLGEARSDPLSLLIEDLNRSGRYLELKNQLKSLVVQITQVGSERDSSWCGAKRWT